MSCYQEETSTHGSCSRTTLAVGSRYLRIYPGTGVEVVPRAGTTDPLKSSCINPARLRINDNTFDTARVVVATMIVS